MTTNAEQQPYRVCSTGPRLHYVQEVATNELKGSAFRTKKAAQAAVTGWNARRA